MLQYKRSGGNEGQALVETIVVMPVLLLLLLAAADMGKLFVISGKSEISARYIALSHFREAPFADAYPAQTEGQEIERLFFDDALDDSGLPAGLGSEADDPDVNYQELGDSDLVYAPGPFGDPFLVSLWDFMNGNGLLPIRGARSAFTYDLPFFPYGREHPMEETRDLQIAPSESRLAASYDATGNFVMLTSCYSGAHGQAIRTFLQNSSLILGAGITSLLHLWRPFLP